MNAHRNKKIDDQKSHSYLIFCKNKECIRLKVLNNVKCIQEENSNPHKISVFNLSLRMIKSMTGYGVANNDGDNSRFSVEIKSLNSKFLELNLRLPKEFSDKELLLRNECSKRLERGKVNVTISSDIENPLAKAAKINKPLLQHYYIELKSVAEELGASTSNLLETALTLPEVISFSEAVADQGEWEKVYEVFLKAIEQFNKFREDEGEVLKNDLSGRVESIMTLQSLIEEKETDRIPLIREKLTHYLDKAVGKDNVDQNRFEQELIYYIDKLDITEEKVRLSSHCNYFIKALNAEDANGKKLAFISQEMGREINTLGSKANNAEIQQLVVKMKEELEKIKEQLLNVL
jgi:uncharacterized protein (TIGR00255 family)